MLFSPSAVPTAEARWYCPTAKPLCLKLSSGKPKPLQSQDKYRTLTVILWVCAAASAVPSTRVGVVKVIRQHFEDKEIGLSQKNSDARVQSKQIHGHTLLCCMQEMAESVYKYPHHQQCCGRQCLRVFWSFVLINHTEQERRRERERETNGGCAGAHLGSWYLLFQTSSIFHFSFPLPSLIIVLLSSFTSLVLHPGFYSSPCPPRLCFPVVSPVVHLLFPFFLSVPCTADEVHSQDQSILTQTCNLWYLDHRLQVCSCSFTHLRPSSRLPSFSISQLCLHPSTASHHLSLPLTITLSPCALYFFAIPSQSSRDSTHSLSVQHTFISSSATNLLWKQKRLRPRFNLVHVLRTEGVKTPKWPNPSSFPFPNPWMKSLHVKTCICKFLSHFTNIAFHFWLQIGSEHVLTFRTLSVTQLIWSGPWNKRKCYIVSL